MDRFEKLAGIYKTMKETLLEDHSAYRADPDAYEKWLNLADSFFACLAQDFAPDRTDLESMHQMLWVFSKENTKAMLDVIDFSNPDHLRKIDPFLISFVAAKKTIFADKMPFSVSSGKMESFTVFSNKIRPWIKWTPPTENNLPAYLSAFAE